MKLLGVRKLTRRSLLASSAALLAGCSAQGNLSAEELPRRIAPRELGGRKLALVLGAGGPRGFAHLGAIAALEELGVKADLYVGSSVGAVIATLMSSGMKSAALRELGMNLSATEVIDVGLSSIVTREVYTGAAVAKLTARYSGITAIEKAAVPLAIAASRLSPTDADAAFFNCGDLQLAVQASAAVVGRAPPVEIGTERFVDADLACPVPARVARSLGAKNVIALDISAWREDTPPGVLANKEHAWLKEAERREAITALERPESDVYLHLRTPYYASFSREYRARLYDLGYAQTMAAAPQIKALLVR